ncbi:MAG: FliH/SctL family protein [Mycobacteriales bacterium]
MSTWSETPVHGTAQRGTVLRGSDAHGVRPARMDADLRTSPFAPIHTVDARLTDPHLQDVVATARQQAVEQGHAEGHRAGYAAGLAVATAEAHVAAEHAAQQAADAQARQQAQLVEAVALLAGAAEAFRQREAVSLAEIEHQVVDLALDVARAVLDRELSISENPGRDALVRALVLAPEDCAATAKLHPDDAAVLGEVNSLAAGRRVVVVADRSIERGGCVVEAAGRQVDAQIGPALARVAAVLRGQQP